MSIVGVDLKNILVSNSVMNAVKYLDFKYRGQKIQQHYKFKIDPESAPFPLNRIEDNLQHIINTKVFIPVKLKRYGNTNFYTIIDGRHRVAISIAFDVQEIPAIIIE